MPLTSGPNPVGDVFTSYQGSCEQTVLVPACNEVVSTSRGVVCEPIPTAFLEALRDFERGNTVDLDTALNEPPPGE